MADPRIAVEHPQVASLVAGTMVELHDLLHLTCSACGGPQTDYCSTDDRQRLQLLARAHADEVHDGLADRVGWA